MLMATAFRSPAGAGLVEKSANFSDVTNLAQIDLRFVSTMPPTGRLVINFIHRLPNEAAATP
jgi:hypothetical protein